jgi:hypothetical protein
VAAASTFVPAANAEQYSQEIQVLLRDRVEPSAPVWITGHVDDWSKTALPGFLSQFDKPVRTEILETRSFAAWLQLDKLAKAESPKRIHEP